MNLDSEQNQYKFPYLSTGNNEKQVINDFKDCVFQHLHIMGASGIGKTRYIHEILQQFDDSVIVFHYNSSPLDNKQNAFENNIKSILLSDRANKDQPPKDVVDLIYKKSISNHIIIAIDDLHYEDDGRDNFIEKIVDRFDKTDNHVTLITASRYKYNLLKAMNHRLIELQNFSKTQASEFIEYGCKKNKSLKMLSKNLLETSEGNPLYISEFMNFVFLATENPLMDINFNGFFNLEGVETLYQFFMSALNKSEKEALQAASILGKNFRVNDLKYLIPNHKDYLLSILKSFHSKRLLLEIKENEEYAFVHDKQLTSFYKSAELNDRLAWHIALAENFKCVKNYQMCGYHLFYGQMHYESIPYLTYTARKLLKEAKPKLAESYFLKAFEAMHKSGVTHYNSFFKLKLDYCQSLIMQGEAQKLAPIIEELKRNQIFNSDKIFKSKLLEIEISHKWISNDFSYDYIIEALEKLSNNSSSVNQKFRLYGMLVDIGFSRESISMINHFNQSIENKKYITVDSFSPIKITLNAVLANAYAQQAMCHEMLQCTEKCLEEIKITDKPAYKIYGLAFCAKAMQALGMYDEAMPLIEEAYALNQETKIGIVTPDIYSIYADNLRHHDDLMSSMLMYDNLMDFIEIRGNEANKAFHLTLQSLTYHKLNCTTLSIDLLIRAIDNAQNSSNAYQESYACYELSKIYFEIGDNDSGELYAEYAKRINFKIKSKLLENKIYDLIHKYVIKLDSKVV